MSGHTAGPWSVHKAFPVYVVPADQSTRPIGAHTDLAQDRLLFAHEIAVCDRSANRIPKSQRKANARLIAAAPELLAIAERIRDDLSWRTNDNALWTDLLAAIAKATQP